jgi:hypothetical protein
MASDELPRPSLTRRQLAFLVGAVPLTARAASASPRSAAAPLRQATNLTPVDTGAKAEDDVRKNSDRLRQIELDTDVEPAFVFHP